MVQQRFALEAGVAAVAMLQSVEARLVRRLPGIWYVENTWPLLGIYRGLVLRWRDEALPSLLPVLASSVALLLRRTSIIRPAL